MSAEEKRQVAKKIPTHFYVYEITHSTTNVPVGSFVVDKGRELDRTWEFMDLQTEQITSMTGSRRDRACSTCYATQRLVRAHGHDHPHLQGPPLVPAEALTA